MIDSIEITLLNEAAVQLPFCRPFTENEDFSEDTVLATLRETLSMLQRISGRFSLCVALHIRASIKKTAGLLPNDENDKLLTRREKEVLKMMFDGFTNKEIAQKLFISFETVKSHRKNILTKTGSKNTAALTKNLTSAIIDELKK